MVAYPAQLLPGTLDLLILRAVSLGPPIAAGRKRLREEIVGWNRLAFAIECALSQHPEET
jgi:hypothetical protein